jgi:hypothetical protein
MYFFYIDESGTPESSDTTSRFFVVCSTVFHNSIWPDLYGKMEGLKKQFFLSTFSHHGSEIKGSDLLSKHGVKSYLKRNFAHQVLNIHDSFHLPVFVVVIDKYKSRKPSEYSWLYPLCIQYLQISIHRFLEDQGGDHRGILILDEINPKRTLIHSKEHLTYRFGNPRGRQYTRIVEAPFFVNSVYSPGIQIADLYATIFRRQEEMAAKGEYCKFTEQFYRRARVKTYETKKLTDTGFKITGYLKPFK